MTVVRPCCRDRLQPEDLTLLAEHLAEGSSRSAANGLLCDAAERDRILDHGEVLKLLLEAPLPLQFSAPLYFYVLARHQLRDAGVDDRELADYVASLMLHYMEAQRLHDAVGQSGRNAAFVAFDILQTMQEASATEQFFYAAFLAEQSLFFAGCFRPYLESRQQRRGAPSLDYYESLGETYYRAAGGHRLAGEFAIGHLYDLLADVFRVVRRAVNRMAEEFTFLGTPGPVGGDLPWQGRSI